MWQQTPRAGAGGLFSRKYFDKQHIIKREEVPAGLRYCRYYDWAYSEEQINKSDPDYTASAKMAFMFDEYYESFDIYLVDLFRMRASWSDVKSRLYQQAVLDGPECYIGGEANSTQKIAVDDIMHSPRLAGYTVWGIPTNKKKVEKAQPWMDRARVGMMYLVDADWIYPFFDEGEAFPNGVKDDLVDAVSGAYIMCAQRASFMDFAVTERKLLSRW